MAQNMHSDTSGKCCVKNLSQSTGSIKPLVTKRYSDKFLTKLEDIVVESSAGMQLQKNQGYSSSAPNKSVGIVSQRISALNVVQCTTKTLPARNNVKARCERKWPSLNSSQPSSDGTKIFSKSDEGSGIVSQRICTINASQSATETWPARNHTKAISEEKWPSLNCSQPSSVSTNKVFTFDEVPVKGSGHSFIGKVNPLPDNKFSLTKNPFSSDIKTISPLRNEHNSCHLFPNNGKSSLQDNKAVPKYINLCQNDNKPSATYENCLVNSESIPKDTKPAAFREKLSPGEKNNSNLIGTRSASKHISLENKIYPQLNISPSNLNESSPNDLQFFAHFSNPSSPTNPFTNNNSFPSDAILETSQENPKIHSSTSSFEDLNKENKARSVKHFVMDKLSKMKEIKLSYTNLSQKINKPSANENPIIEDKLFQGDKKPAWNEQIFRAEENNSPNINPFAKNKSFSSHTIIEDEHKTPNIHSSDSNFEVLTEENKTRKLKNFITDKTNKIKKTMPSKPYFNRGNSCSQMNSSEQKKPSTLRRSKSQINLSLEKDSDLVIISSQLFNELLMESQMNRHCSPTSNSSMTDSVLEQVDFFPSAPLYEELKK